MTDESKEIARLLRLLAEAVEQMCYWELRFDIGTDSNELIWARFEMPKEMLDADLPWGINKRLDVR